MMQDENPAAETPTATPNTPAEPAEDRPTPGITYPEPGHSEHGEKPTGVRFPDFERK